MKEHRLKSWPGEFEALIQGEKSHEWRKNDRDFACGDTLVLCEWDNVKETFTGRVQTVVVTHINHGPAFEIPEGFCVMSIWPIEVT